MTREVVHLESERFVKRIISIAVRDHDDSFLRSCSLSEK